MENSPPEPWASGCFLRDADMAFRFLTYFHPRVVFTGCYVQVLLLIHNAHVQNLEFRGKLAEVRVTEKTLRSKLQQACLHVSFLHHKK